MEQPLIQGIKTAFGGENYRTHSLSNGQVIIDPLHESKKQEIKQRLHSLASQGADNPGEGKRTRSLATR